MSLERELIERMSVGALIWQVSSANPCELALVSANAAASRISGISFSQHLGRDLSEWCPAALTASRPAVYAEVARSGVEALLPTGNYPELGKGSVFGRLVPLPDQHVAVLFDDAKQRELAEEQTRNLNAFLDSIIDNIPAMVFVKDAEHLRYELFNRAGELLSGFKRENIYGKSPRDLFPEVQADFFLAKDRAVLSSGQMLDIPEEPVDTPLGRRWLHTKKIPILKPDGQPSHLLGISLDITDSKAATEALARAHGELELRVQERTGELHEANQQLQREMDERQRAQEALVKAEEQLRQAQKMEAVGRLAGGIAHDFNNLLSVILSYASLLAAGPNERVSVADGVNQIRRASERAAALTRQLLAFSRQQVLAPRVVDLNEIVLGLSGMLRRLIGEDIALNVIQAQNLGRTRADIGQFEQVIMNLVVNARDAMPGGGELTIETRNVELTEAAAQEHSVGPGPYVSLNVRDTGSGMDQATLARIFEPFFSTKPHGKGTGLGLATVFGIVKQSGGHIAVESEPGRGSCFEIYFARTEDPVSHPAPPEPPRSASPGTETLLLVEDDPQVRQIASEILKLHGYRVLDASGPSHALELSAGFGERIDLLVTDVVMPEMNGRALAERLREARPELEVLYMSGYTHDALLPGNLLSSGVAFLQKPITPVLLASAVRQLLDGQAHGSRQLQPGG
jgi:two-component system, cell cycle sensor histidine kinase and response regulator CckA